MKSPMRSLFVALLCAVSLAAASRDHHGIVFAEPAPGRMALIHESSPAAIAVDPGEDSAVKIAAANLAADFGRVCGTDAGLLDAPLGERVIIAGTASGPTLAPLRSSGAVDLSALDGKTEQYVITTVDNPLPGVEQAVVIAGSDRRGVVYGIYELSEQIGVSPWYDWADVPAEKHHNLWLAPGSYTAGEPAVRYRGLFLNDEAPCLTSWVKNTYGTDYGDHRFYERVFELLLRLRGNYMWPAMWSWAFYADDPENSATARRMGVIMGTSHHEPMARNHQEWARNRDRYGKWNYAANQKTIDRFFAEGIERLNGAEDVATIGMRGDGDEAMSEDADVALLKRVIDNQRKIIARKTGRKASDTPQLWALYKEVLDYYDKGLRVPDDVIMLVCDDNWGNVRRLPSAREREHPGGWGMYYHVDYVGAPRNTKWINVTPIQGMWEQLRLTYDYGVDRLWILNVGDLKPMEYPISLFMSMAWNPGRYDASNFMEHSLEWCAQQFGAGQAAEAARILNLYSKYNGRVTAEMLDKDTYNLETGEWRRVAGDYARLEAEALRQYLELPEQYRDAYFELILYPVQAMANLYEMYYAQAMNHRLHAAGDPAANDWADLCERCFRRDAELSARYNRSVAGGKWNGMMTQKHIGYTSWNDNFAADTLPELRRVDDAGRAAGGYVSQARDGVVVIEAEHFREAEDCDGASWTVVPDMGRTLSGVALMPYTVEPRDAALIYEFEMPQQETPDSVTVHVVVKSTLDFTNRGGHCYDVVLDGGRPATVNFNALLNERPENIYTVFYPTVASRVVKSHLRLPVDALAGRHRLRLVPRAPGIVFEKIIVDAGGYKDTHLFMEETPYSRRDVTRE